MSEKKLIPGKTFNLSGVDYVIPPLSPKRVKAIQEKNLEVYLTFQPIVKELEEVQKTVNAGTETIDSLTRAVQLGRKVQDQELEISCQTAYAAFSRNYPEISYDDFTDLPTMAQVKDLAQWALAGDISAKKD